MTLETFTTGNTELTLVVESLNSVPTDVTVTFPDGSTVTTSTYDSAVDDVYTYKIPTAYSDGVFYGVVTSSTDAQVAATIANLTKGITYLVNKVLNSDFDCLLMQKMYAVESYVYSGKWNEANSIYNALVLGNVPCVTTYTPEITEVYIWVINGVLIKQ
tara:strand:+ start:40038 stop:40514 length:477 start_codon:yes stop_codon:yes gene_type:complete